MQRNDISALFQAAALSGAGFESVGRTSVIQRLNNISPQGNTAFRDAVITGIGLILKLNDALSQLGGGNTWNFLQIVITDGCDNSSKRSLQQTGAIMMQVGMTIPNSRCKTVFIGVDLGSNSEAVRDIGVLNAVGGDTTLAYQINNVQIGQIFDRIKVDLGIQRNLNLLGLELEETL